MANYFNKLHTKKNFPTIFLLLTTIGFWLLANGCVLAAEPYTLEMPLNQGSTQIQGPAAFVRMVFIYGLGLVGITALFAMVYGGFRYMTSGGGSGVAKGKEWIWGALSGIVLLLCSYLILYTINPDLVSFREPTLEKIVIEPPAPPTQQMLALGDRTGILPGQTTFRDDDMLQRFNDRAPNNLRQVVNASPFPINITSYDQGSHATNSDHYQGKAIDIYTGNMTDDQMKTLLTYLDNNPSVSKVINGRMPEYNTLNGKSWNYETNSPGINQQHASHIHVSVY